MDVLKIFALQALSPFSVTTLTCCMLIISGGTGICGLTKGASSGCEGIDVCSLALWLTTFSPQPAVVCMPTCIPWLFQPVFNSYFVYTAQGPSHFLCNCLVFSPDVFKLLCLENSNGKTLEKIKCGLLHMGYRWSCSPGVGIHLRQVGSLAATTHPALWSPSSLKFSVKSWPSSKATSPLWRWFPYGLGKIISWRVFITFSWKNRSYSKTPASLLEITASDLCYITPTNPGCCFYCD